MFYETQLRRILAECPPELEKSNFEGKNAHDSTSARVQVRAVAARVQVRAVGVNEGGCVQIK